MLYLSLEVLVSIDIFYFCRLFLDFWCILYLEYGIVVYLFVMIEDIELVGFGVDKIFIEVYVGYIGKYYIMILVMF